LPGVSAPYQYDDFNTPVGDPASQSLSAWWQAMPQTLRPLTKLSYAFESSLGAVDAPSRRLFNALIFGACVALVNALARSAGASRMVALIVATTWALHPVHAETIVALAGRPVLLCLFFTLTSAWLLLEKRPWLALTSAFLALLCRESGLPWLVACGVLSAQALGMPKRRVWGLASGVALTGLLCILSVRTLRELLVSSLGAPGAVNRLGLQWAALSHGTAALLLDPGSFTLDMDFTPSGVVRLLLITAAASLYAGAAWLALRKESSPAVRVSALLWVCLVIPTHSFIAKVDPFTARPFSASSAALAVLLAALLTTTGPAVATRIRWVRPIFVVAAAAALLGLGSLTFARASLYQDPVALWRDAADRSTHSTRPLVNLGTLLAQRGRPQEAESALEAALVRDPRSLELLARLGTIRRLTALSHPHPSDPFNPNPNVTQLGDLP
jgi:protein O-mannosyl-transferase